MTRTLNLDQIGQLWFDSSAEALLVVNAEGAIVAANRRSSLLFGYDQEELLSMKVEQLIPSRYRSGHVKHRRQFQSSPEQRSMGIGMDLLALNREGEEIPVEISMNHMEVDGEGYTLALVSDIRRRKAIERELHVVNTNLENRIESATRELRESQKLHEVIARQFPNGTINVLDRNLNYVFVEGKELFKMGVTSERLIGTSYVNRLAQDFRAHAKQFLESVLKGKAETFEVFHQGQFYQLDAVPLLDERNEVDRLLVVEHNISGQKEAERNMREALAKEKELGELKSRFVSMASHEFRTPLTSVMSSASILQKYLERETDSTLTPKRQKHLTRIRQAVQHLNSILDDFLSLDKLESGATSVKAEVVDLKSLFEDVVQDMRSIDGESDRIDLELDLEARNAQLDPRIVRNITINLLSNALKYSPNQKPVTLSVSSSPQALNVRCTDRGIGIPETEQKFMYERFFRANNVSNIQGTGLGLNIVRRYLSLVDGDISFTSKEGEGTTFEFQIPIQPQPAEA